MENAIFSEKIIPEALAPARQLATVLIHILMVLSEEKRVGPESSMWLRLNWVNFCRKNWQTRLAFVDKSIRIKTKRPFPNGEQTTWIDFVRWQAGSRLVQIDNREYVPLKMIAAAAPMTPKKGP